jgi:hypothetical protein
LRVGEYSWESQCFSEVSRLKRHQRGRKRGPVCFCATIAVEWHRYKSIQSRRAASLAFALEELNRKLPEIEFVESLQ